MENQEGFDPDKAPIGEGEPKKPTVRVAAVKPKTQVDSRPLGVQAAVGAPEKVAGAEKTEQTKEAAATPPAGKPITEESPDGKIKATVDAIVARELGEFDLQLNQLFCGKRSVELLDSKLRALYPTDEVQQKAAKNPLSLFNLLLSSFRDGWGTNQSASYLAVLDTVAKNAEKKVLEHLADSKAPELQGLADGTTHKLNTASVDVDGDEARDSFMAAISGLKRIKLLNSGFWVTLRRPLIHELQDIFDAADMEQRDVGYSIGPNFALVADIFIKKRFCDALIKYRIIRDSNLVDIYKDNNFFKALSFHDYEVLLHGVLSLMSRKGIRARLVCPECMHATIVDNIDINSAKYYNKHLITPELRAWWETRVGADGKPIRRTVEDCEKYRREVLNFTHEFTEDFETAKIKICMREPSMDEYFTVGEKIVSLIQRCVDENSKNDEDRRRVILANLSAHAYHMITPWVDHIEQIDEDGTVLKRTSNRDAILDTFDITTQDRSMRPLDELATMCANSKICFIGTFALECPYCHAKPDVGADQFYPLEVQAIFFGHLFHRLPAELMPTGE